MFVQAFGQIAKERRRHREVEGADAVGAHEGGQRLPAFGAARVEGDEIEQAEKGGEILFAGRFLAAEFGDRGTRHGAIAVAVHIAARGPDQAHIAFDLTGDKAPEEGRQNLAPRQIAGAAKYHQIEGIDRDHPRGHGLSPLLVIRLFLWRSPCPCNSNMLGRLHNGVRTLLLPDRER